MKLSRRETECMQLLCRGLENDAIAASLGISPSSVKVYLYAKAFVKLNATNRAHAAAIFTRAQP